MRLERCTELNASSKRKLSVTVTKEYADQVYWAISRTFRYKIDILKSVCLVYMHVVSVRVQFPGVGDKKKLLFYVQLDNNTREEGDFSVKVFGKCFLHIYSQCGHAYL